MPQLRTFSYGGGVQSTAALVLAARGDIDYSTFLFANVGDDSEHPDTLAYVHDIAMPYAISNGIVLREIQRIPTRGRSANKIETIYQRVMTSRSQVIPGYLATSGAPGNRSCTTDFKIRTIARVQKELGATPDNPAVVGLGISIDEYQRMRTDSGIAWQILEYPLIDLRLTRADCRRIIVEAGLPVPPKSACYFCPYQSLRRWRDMKEHRPDLFANAVALEQRMLTIAAERNDAIYLTSKLIPLEQAVAGTQHELDLDTDDACESGFCMT
jgi:hypothetical protein